MAPKVAGDLLTQDAPVLEARLDRLPAVEATADARLGGETLDTIFQGALKLYQSRDGYRFSLDAVLLAHFVTIRGGERVADLGAGNGVVSLILAYRHPSLTIAGVELQEGMVERAVTNIQLNGFDKRVKVIRGDVRTIEKLFSPESFDAVLCNPPYREPGSGRLSPNVEKKIARHQVKGGVDNFLRAGAYLLPMKGRIALVYSAGRVADLLQAMRSVGIEPKRLRMVHSFAGAEAALVLAEGVKGGKSGVKALSPLVIYRSRKEYTPEVEMLLSAVPPKFGAHRAG